MTDEELDYERGKEAYRQSLDRSNSDHTNMIIMATIAARLARENWVPVDPDLIEAREIYASSSAYRHTRVDIYAGKYDGDLNRSVVGLICQGIKLGRELARKL